MLLPNLKNMVLPLQLSFILTTPQRSTIMQQYFYKILSAINLTKIMVGQKVLSIFQLMLSALDLAKFMVGQSKILQIFLQNMVSALDFGKNSWSVKNSSMFYFFEKCIKINHILTFKAPLSPLLLKRKWSAWVIY